MFGVEKGAYTSSVTRKGLFEEANGGTIFLDEIGTLAFKHQQKLLRVLDDGSFHVLGTNREVRSNARLISATNADLVGGINSKTFREDLFHRINAFQVKLPTLKERAEDIPVLLLYYLQHFNKALKKNILGFTQEAKDILSNYSWPGNIRELRNAIERGVILCGNGYIAPKDIQLQGSEELPGQSWTGAIEKRH